MERKPIATLAVGAKAPHFALNGIDGRLYALKEATAAGPLLLVFFKVGCPACDLAFPYLSRLPEAYPHGWRIWALSQNPPDRSAEYARSLGLSFPVLVDEAGFPVSMAYDPPATPTLYLIEADATIAYASHGFSKDDLNQLSGLLAERLEVDAKVIAPEDDGQPHLRPG